MCFCSGVLFTGFGFGEVVFLRVSLKGIFESQSF